MTICPPPPAPAVKFDFNSWSSMFPELVGITAGMAAGYFARAGLICANNTCNPFYCAGTLQTLLYLLTAHLALLNAPRDASGAPSSTGQPAPGLVGRISNASEGSVSVSVEWSGSGSPSEAWFLQTRYGAEYWQATAQTRTARYLANPVNVPSAIFPMRFGRFGGRRSW